MGYLTPVVHPLDESQRPGGKSVGGFFGNLWGDVGEIVHGLSSLGGMVINDAVGGIKEVATLGQSENDFMLDDLAKAIPNIAKQYGHDYGSVGNFGEHLYNDPLSVVGDALTLATLGGYGAVKGAQAASKTAAVADDLARLGAGTATLDEVSGLTRFAQKVLPGLGTEDAAANLAGFRPRLTPGETEVTMVPRHLNPTRRFWNEKVLEPLMTNPIDALRGASAEKAGLAEDLMRYGAETGAQTTPAAKQMGVLSDYQKRLVDMADEYNAKLTPTSSSSQLTRYEKPFIADHRIRKVTDRLFGFHTTKFIKERNEYMREIDDFFKGKVKNVDGTVKHTAWAAEDIENFHKYLQIDPPVSFGRMTYQEIADSFNDLANSRLKDMPYIAEVLEPHVQRISRMLNDPEVNPEELQAAVKYVESLSERVGIEEAIQGGQHVDHIAEAVADMRLWVDKRLSNPLMQRGMLGYRTAVDRSFIAHRASGREAMTKAKDAINEALEAGEMAPEDAIRMLAPDQGESILTRIAAGEDPESVLDQTLGNVLAADDAGYGIHMADRVMQAGRQLPVYFPHIDPKRTRFIDFLMRRTSRGIMEGSKGYLKENRGWLMENLRYIDDPVEAYSRRVSQVTRDLETLDMVEAVFNRFGRDIDKWDDVVEGAEAVMHPESARIMVSTKIHVENEIAERLKGIKMGPGGPVGVEDAVADAIVAGIKRTEDGFTAAAARGGKIKAIPKVVADRLDNYTKVRLGWQVRMFWDAPINLWRSLVLAGSPRWVFYNLLGNMTFLKMQGGKLADVLHLAISPKYRKAVQDLIEASGAEAQMGVTGGFMSGTTQYVTHYGPAENTAIAQLYRTAQRTKVGAAGRRYSTMVRRFNEHIEDAFRSASYLQGLRNAGAARGVKMTGLGFIRSEKKLRQLISGGIDEKDAVRALDEVNYFFNNYQALGPWERNVVRRFISPFYSFYKHTVKLMLQFPFTNPIRAQVMRHLTDLGNEFTGAYGPTPDWLEGSVITDNLGQTAPLENRFINARGVNPFSALGQQPEDFLFGQMNPFLKMGYEQATGESTLTGEPFTAPDIISGFGSDQQYRINPDTMSIEQVDRYAPGLGQHLLSQIPQYVLGRDLIQSLLGGSGSRYSTGDIIQQPGGEEPLYPSNPFQELGQFVGLSTTDYNLLKYQMRRFEETQDALKSMLATNPQLFTEN